MRRILLLSSIIVAGLASGGYALAQTSHAGSGTPGVNTKEDTTGTIPYVPPGSAGSATQSGHSKIDGNSGSGNGSTEPPTSGPNSTVHQ